MGGVSERPARAAWRSNPSNVPTLASVEGTLVHATSSTFAGRRSNVSLGRSDACAAGLVPMQAVAPMTTGALWKKEEGNVVSMREAHALDASMPKKHRHVQEDTSFTRSRDPCTSIGTQLRLVLVETREPAGGVATVEVSRSGKPAQAGGTGTGAMIGRTLRGSPRVTALQVKAQGSCVMRKKRKVVMATVPARKRETRAQRPYVGCSCRSRRAAS
ncbi:MAG: hypothetical protein QOI41_107 [Myxococcales bacterium]|nr:hypothetical protein [Myxococcales bacterium]